MGPGDPGHPHLVEHAGGDGLADQRKDLELVLPNPVVGIHTGVAECLEDGPKEVEGNTSFPAHLTVSARRALGPSPERRGLQEGEGHAAFLNRPADPLHGKSRALARLR